MKRVGECRRPHRDRARNHVVVSTRESRQLLCSFLCPAFDPTIKELTACLLLPWLGKQLGRSWLEPIAPETPLKFSLAMALTASTPVRSFATIHSPSKSSGLPSNWAARL